MRLPDDKLITPTLLRRFKDEADLEGGNGQHYALLQLENGNLTKFNPYSPNLAPEQILWAADVLRLLNRELHHDGAWVVVFTNPKPSPGQCIMAAPTHCDYERYGLIWLDADGDCQFTVEWAAGESGDLIDFADVMIAGKESTAEKCEAAWEAWHLMMRKVLEPKPEQLFKRAQGQRAPSARH